MYKNLTTAKKISITIIGLYLLLAISAKLLMPYAIDDISAKALLRPSLTHLLGTDEMGRDLLSLLLNGFKTTISIATISALASTAIASTLAVIAVHKRGIIEEALIYLSNFFIIVPEIIIIMAVAVFAKPSVNNTIIAIIVFSWSKVFKIVRAKLLSYMEKDKVRYTILLKGSVFDILTKLRHDLYPIIVTNLILQCNKAVMYETTLSYFGIGDPLSKTWGKTIKAALNYENLFYDNVFWWYLIPPVACVFVFIISLSVLTMEEG